MVLAEKNNENARNGRRSRGPSPNGHVQAESTSEDESTVPVDKIRVGRDYQAICPELQPENQRKPEMLTDRALLVWSPTDNIPDYKLEEYIVLAKDKYGYNGEQALGMLFWHKHDLDRAVLDLANFTPFPDDWSVEDKVLFEQAFQFHGKSFHRIKQMLPDKSIASLVKYYYSWKKTRSRSSLMDKQARKLNTPKEEGAQSEVGSEGGSNEESDHDEKGEGGRCSNCNVVCTIAQTNPKGSVCNSCFQHWRRTGMQRPTSGPATGGKRGAPPGARHRRKPPRGMYINHDDLVVMAAGDAGAQMLKAMEREIDSLQRQIQQNKQQISCLKRKHSDSLDDVSGANGAASAPAADPQRFNARWSSEEKLLAVQGLRKYGRDFKSIADVLGNKTEHHIRQFFINYRKRYNLDNVMRDWERDNGIEEGAEKTEMETDAAASDEVICISPTPSNGSAKKDVKNGKVTPQLAEK